ncbi:NrfD/PsrC family molybdoenzyme membrane anchor subunit [Raoultibacter timonensis]|uniref:Oxidoreductase n=1 Tax=Raoultibacter timonensis TaxID=1907662 RepID=A0ABN6MBQ9_9ACTN|nr:NrfD/PsrC family molybdoenzyme membrane anchor subunit [Raoultibacter timonensis]BDE95421.1 oxidoreductase [Raoultibacter timonensis]BDF50024.1 oxidoreductase [Raoultibacter timonensis]
MAELQSVWGWQPALYLFLGGMGAGAFITAAVLYFFDKKNNEKTICFATWAATISLIVGLLLLLSELTNPLRGMLLWQSFSNGSSWMTFGAWAVFAAVIVFGLMALLSTRKLVVAATKKWKKFSKVRSQARNVLAALGIVLGVVVAVYTGVLLMSAPGVPLWNTLLLPCLFAVSALDTGVALVEIIAVTVERKQVGPRKASKAHRLLKRFVVVLVLVELVVLFVFLNTMLSGSSDNAAVAATGALSADLLMWGTLAPFFWGLVVACGLVLPLVAAIVGLAARSKSSDSLAVVGASGALLGGCALRFLVLMAGLHADVVANAVATLIH